MARLYVTRNSGRRASEAVISTQAQRRPAKLRLSRLVESPTVSIAGREIGRHRPPYIVAELSCNHSGSFEKARELISAAKEADADAVKLQTYTPGELTTPEHAELWALYEQAQTPREWHETLFSHARAIGITIFSSAFSVEGVRFLRSLGSPAIKIASAEIRDRGLIKEAINTGLPVIISTGMARPEDLICLPINTILLHCVAQYPSTIKEANLKAMATLRYDYDLGYELVGLSDHTLGYETAIAATALGAVMIEKHFKLDDDCIDAAYSLDPNEFGKMCKAVRAIWHGMGDGVIRPTCEPRSR
jgi:sialic acid synthase SpsE